MPIYSKAGFWGFRVLSHSHVPLRGWPTPKQSIPTPLFQGIMSSLYSKGGIYPAAKKISSGDIPNSMRHPAALAEPRGTLVEPSWNPRGTWWNLVELGGTWRKLVEPSWNLTSGPPRTTPAPIWAETPKLSAVGEKASSKTLPFSTTWPLKLFSGAPPPHVLRLSWRSASRPAAPVLLGARGHPLHRGEGDVLPDRQPSEELAPPLPTLGPGGGGFRTPVMANLGIPGTIPSMWSFLEGQWKRRRRCPGVEIPPTPNSMHLGVGLSETFVAFLKMCFFPASTCQWRRLEKMRERVSSRGIESL